MRDQVTAVVIRLERQVVVAAVAVDATTSTRVKILEVT